MGAQAVPLCCPGRAQNRLLEPLLPREQRVGLQLSALPSTCPPQETFAVGPLGALADVPMPLLHVPSRSSLSISAMDKAIAQVAPPTTFIHCPCHHSPERHSQPAGTSLQRSGGKRLTTKAYFLLPMALWAGEQEGGTPECRPQAAIPMEEQSSTAARCHQTGAQGMSVRVLCA